MKRSLLLLLILSACGYSKAVTMPEPKGFVLPKEEATEGIISEQSPFMYLWRDPHLSEIRTRASAEGAYNVYIAPVGTEFLDLEEKDSSFQKRVQTIADYLKDRITKTVNESEKDPIKVAIVENRNEADFELQIQMTEIGFGSPLLYTAAWAVPLPGTATAYDANYNTVLSLEGRFLEISSEEASSEEAVIAELIDRRISRIRILDLNKVFSKTSPLRDICNDYGTVFARALTSPPDEKVKNVSKFTLIPW